MSNEFAISLSTTVPATLASAVAAFRTIKLDGLTLSINLSAVALNIAAIVLKSHIGSKKDRKQEEKESPLDLSACVYVLRAALLKFKGIDPTEDTNRVKLRVTIHEVLGETTEQLVDYAGGDGGGAKRPFPSRRGVIGRVITSHKPQRMHRAEGSSWDDYIKELCDNWMMHEGEATTLRRDRFSFMGIPLKGTEDGKETIAGVVFFDSSEVNFFAERDEDFAVAACVGVAEYTKFRYP